MFTRYHNFLFEYVPSFHLYTIVIVLFLFICLFLNVSCIYVTSYCSKQHSKTQQHRISLLQVQENKHKHLDNPSLNPEKLCVNIDKAFELKSPSGNTTQIEFV